MGSDFSWSFATTGQASLWSPSTVPANLDSFDPNAVELGVKFRSDVSGSVTAIRFYKGPSDTGTHVVKLWSGDGTLLASATSAGETASGWQTVALPSPVAISANTIYIASYHTTSGHYTYNHDYVASTGVDNGVLHAPSSPSVGGNGVYLYGAGGFPTETYRGSNYWIDIVFRP